MANIESTLSEAIGYLIIKLVPFAIGCIIFLFQKTYGDVFGEFSVIIYSVCAIFGLLGIILG